jgi:hypothetical protein
VAPYAFARLASPSQRMTALDVSPAKLRKKIEKIQFFLRFSRAIKKKMLLFHFPITQRPPVMNIVPLLGFVGIF